MHSCTDGPAQRRRNTGAAVLDPLQRARHARYFEGDVLYHVIFRVTQGFLLLAPDAQGLLRSMTAGIIGHARETYPMVRNYATTLLSNHGHLEIGGDIEHLAAYVGFIKRELSRRWGPEIGWRGIFEEGYHATALITPRAQERCLKYILSQGVHEGLVETPLQCRSSKIVVAWSYGPRGEAIRFVGATPNRRRLHEALLLAGSEGGGSLGIQGKGRRRCVVLQLAPGLASRQLTRRGTKVLLWFADVVFPPGLSNSLDNISAPVRALQ